MDFETLELELSDDDQLRLICVTFGIGNDLLEDIKERHTDHDERIVKLVLSEAVARSLQALIKTNTTEDEKDSGEEYEELCD